MKSHSKVEIGAIIALAEKHHACGSAIVELRAFLESGVSLARIYQMRPDWLTWDRREIPFGKWLLCMWAAFEASHPRELGVLMFPKAPGANLSGANLSGADLSGADLYGANLFRANLYGANRLEGDPEISGWKLINGVLRREE